MPFPACEEGAAPQHPAVGGQLAEAVVAGLMVVTKGVLDIFELALLIGVFLLAGQGITQLVLLLR